MRQADTNKFKAEEAYAREYLRAQDLLESISHLLNDVPAPSDNFQPHWGHVGDLNEVTRRLEAVRAFLDHEEV